MDGPVGTEEAGPPPIEAGDGTRGAGIDATAGVDGQADAAGPEAGQREGGSVAEGGTPAEGGTLAEGGTGAEGGSVAEGGTGAGQSDGGKADASEDAATAGDAACTPLTGEDFYCGAVLCNGATDFCFEGYNGNACMPMPSECQCAETRGCECLRANGLTCDAGASPVNCSTVLYDGGLLFLEALSCP